MPPAPAIAIVGIGCRFPGGASSPEQFWTLLCDGVDAVTEIPRDRFDADALFDPDPDRAGTLYTRWGGFVEDIDRFDAGFFGISPREAQRIDPQHRLLLEVVWEALEDAGQPAERLAGTPTGVYVGVATADYGRMALSPSHRRLLDAYACVGTAGSIAANRVSYHFDLRGPSLAVDTACSSSLVAVHLACQSLASGESTLAIAGGVNAFLSPEAAIGFCKAGMLSPDGRCRAFDARANGYVRAEGAGVVVLKPLADALAHGDPIRAVIRGSATNQDGHTIGIMVPSAEAHQEMLRSALRKAGLDAADIQYVEAHGTGTPVGDPLEARAIGSVFSEGRPAHAPCLIGSVKTNIGHLEAAAGIAGLIKATLALQHRRVPPHLHLERVNPAIPLTELGLRIPTILESWPTTRGPARAGVNSFGFGGTNAHVVLEEPPPRAAPAPEAAEHGGGDLGRRADRAEILTLSAKTPRAVAERAQGYRDHLRDSSSASLPDVCYTAARRRTHHEHRIAVVAGSREAMVERLDAALSGAGGPGTATGGASRHAAPKLAFVFSGMGPQWGGMGRQLARDEPAFRAVIEQCDRLMRPLAGWSLEEELAATEAEGGLARADRAQIANFAVQVALAALWRTWGIVPDAIVGHSAGELAAACVAGALDLPDAVRVLHHRARLQQRAAGTGTMLAVGLGAEAALELIAAAPGAVSLAAVNSPTSVTLAGAPDALEALATALDRRGVFRRRLPVAIPYHGPQMDAIRDELLASLAGLSPRPAGTPIASVVTGEWRDGGGFDRTYWWRNVREPVRFAGALDRLIEAGCEVFVEIGPHPVLAPAVRECLAHRGRTGVVLPTLRRFEDERAVMLGSLAELYVRGCRIEWPALWPSGGTCVSLPPYPWQRERHWFDPAPERDPDRPAGTDSDHPLLGRRLHSARATWEVDLGQAALAYLDGHRVQGSVVFPGAAYVEMALAAARHLAGREAVAIEKLELRRLLVLDRREEIVLQCLHEPRDSTVEIHGAARAGAAPWTLHATARLQPSPPGPTPRADIAAIRGDCAEAVAIEEHYHRFERSQHRYAGAFRAVTALWQGEDQALGRVVLPPGAEPGAAGYGVHPALLDAALQVLLAARPADGELTSGAAGVPRLPVSIDRVAFHRHPGTEFWVHATLGPGESGPVGHVRVLDEAGDVALACEGVRLQALERHLPRRPAEIDDCLFQVCWQPAGAGVEGGRPASPPAGLVASRRAVWEQRAVEEDWAGYYRRFEPRLDTLVRHYVRGALVDLGWRPDRGPALDPGSVATALGVAPRHHRFFARLLEITGTDRGHETEAGAGLPRARALADELWAAHADDRAVIELVRESGERLADTLRGRVDTREAMFTGRSLETLAAFYAGGGPLRHANLVLADLLAAAQEHHAPHRMRILEVGAGTGGATAAVLRRLPPGTFEYVFTDVSPFFVTRARQRFAGHSGLEFEVLDIEADPPARRAFDVVLAADVLHATADVRAALRNLRRLLRPGGLLVLLEVTKRVSWADLVFGGLEGWWRYTDLELRPAYPLLDVRQWTRILHETGYREIEVLSEVFGGGPPLQAVLVGHAPAPDRGSRPADGRPPRAHWLVLADRRGVGMAVAAALRARSTSCTLVRPGGAFRRSGSGEIELDPANAGDWRRLLQEAARGTGPPPAVLHLWAVGGEPPEEGTAAELLDRQGLLCTGVASLVRAMREAGRFPEICLVTAGAQAIDDGDGRPDVGQAALWGVGRVFMNEHPDSPCRLVDLDAAASAEAIEALVEELEHAPHHRELAIRGRQRFVRGLQRLDAAAAARPRPARRVAPDGTAFRLQIGVPGALETLALVEVPHAPPGPGEVVIRVHAASLNFRDVLLALGMLNPSRVDVASTMGELGGDCAGVVVACGDGVDGFRVGDEVIAVTMGRALGSRLTVEARRVVPKPPSLSFAQAASIPAVYLTAHYALNHLARVAEGERVLIHAATGGVGLAAIQLARRAGAAVFATAGSPEKRAYLRSLGLEGVMDSRSLAFADEILSRTGGEGVDVVLNSLGGEAIARGLEILRPYGRFVELGKRDIYENASIGLFAFRRNLSFSAFDLIQLCVTRPALVGTLLKDLVGRVAAGELSLPPIREFDLAEAEAAMRLMAQARHIGKLVLTLGPGRYPVRREDPPLVRPDATYLITGGTGGFGLAVASWLVRAGARHVALMSRRGIPADEDGPALAALLASPATVRIVPGDVSRPEDVSRVLDAIRATSPPLRGVIHAAMVLDDGLLSELGPERFARVLAPKVAGAWNLHRLTLGEELDFFVLFSSLASVMGAVMQGNYAAANAFLDALAAYRHRLGLPGLAVNWGPLAEVGYVSRHPHIREFLEREGLLSLSPAEAVAALERLLRRDVVNAIAVRVDASQGRDALSLAGRYGATLAAEAAPAGSEGANLLDQLRAAAPGDRQRMIEEHLVQRTAKVLGTTPERVPRDRPLPEVGFDSLMAVELQTSLKLDLSVELAVIKFLSGTSLREIGAQALQQLELAAAGTAPARPDPAPPVAAPAAAAAPGRGATMVETQPAAAAIAAGPVGAGGALSHEQRRLWFIDRVGPGNPAYNVCGAVRLTGRLDVVALERSVGEVMRRHHVLRATFEAVEGEPVQTIMPPAAVSLERHDLRALPGDVREEALGRLATAAIRRPFDLARGPLVRGTVIQLGEQEHAVLLVVHHIVADFRAMTMLAAEVMALYDACAAGAPSPLPEPRLQYGDYVRAQAESLAGDVPARQLGYWTEQLAGAPGALRLPADRPAPAVRTGRGGHHRFELPAELSSAVAGLGRRHGATLFMTLLAAFQALLHRYSGADDVSVGTPVATRSLAGAEAIVGCLMNTVVMRTSLAGDPTFRELLRRVRAVALGAYEHQDVPFERVVEALRPSRGEARSPLVQTVLVLHNLRLPELAMRGLTVTPLDVESGTAACDLMLLVDPGERLRGSLEYSGDLFDAGTAERIVGHFRTLLEAAVLDPDRRVSELPLLTPAERRVLEAWNATATPASPACLHELVEAQVERTPDAVAVTGEAEVLTYRELDGRAGAVAARLRAHGVRRDTVVGICVERSPAMVVAVLGVLKAGGAFLLLDPAHPVARLASILEDARAPVLLASAPLVDRLPSGIARVLALDGASVEEGSGRRPPASDPESLAYVMYTSGSTGRPKGVMVPHRAISNQVCWRQAEFPLGPDDVVLQRTPIDFDPAVWELFGPLAAGARLLLPGGIDDRDVGDLVRLVARRGVTTLQVVPSLLDAVLDEPALARCRALRRIFCGGEPLPPALAARCLELLPGTSLHNLYGPTETAIDATHWTCERGGAGPIVPAGRPIGNVQVHVLDESRALVPAGVAGELYIGGAGVARGYLHRPDETAERFLPDPFDARPGARLYRTGDRARWRADGVIELLGRADDQMKIRGVRVEPGEVEAALRGHPAVREAAVVAREEASGQRHMVAYVVMDGAEADGPGEQRIGELRRVMGERLPAHSRPSAIVALDALPRSPHGKVDRAALPPPGAAASGGARAPVAPRDPVEAELARIWEDLLAVHPVGVTDDFFELGGHSLLVVRMLARVQSALGRALPVSSVFEGATIEHLARLLRQGADDRAPSPLVPLVPRGSRRPFFCVHALTGDALCYRELAGHLGGDRPFYAFQAPGLDGEREPCARVEVLAALYLDALRVVQPTGPYLLGGWSMGGMVAFEMARELCARGEEVALVALLDTWAELPDLRGRPDDHAALRSGVARCLGLAAHDVDVLDETFWTLGADEQTRRLAMGVHRVGRILPGAELVRLRRHLQVAGANLEAMRRYVPGAYPGRVVLLAAAERDGVTPREPTLGWGRLAAEGVALHTVPGSHETMLREPHVGRVAERLRQCLDEAERGGP